MEYGNIHAVLLSLDVERQRLMRAWFLLSVSSLAAAGLFSLLLVSARTPIIQTLLPIHDLFRVALVVHVNLSVLVWLLSFGCIFWCLQPLRTTCCHPRLAPALSSLGMLLLIASPFLDQGPAVLSNYIPILDQPLFKTALVIFTLGIGWQLLNTQFIFASFLSPILFASKWCIVLATLVLLYTRWHLPLQSTSSYYEFLFWGAGHILQFSHTILLLLSWLWLLQQLQTLPLHQTHITLLCIVVAPSLAAVPLLMNTTVGSAIQHVSFTELMRYGGLFSLPVGLFIALHTARLLFQKTPKSHRPLKAALINSIILFAAGGIIGFLIEGANVVIPAHYHGSIVGVTLAFMGISYLLLPHLGFASADSSLASKQPYIYGGGQLLHILGLAWSGGYGVQRKTSGDAQILERLPEVMGMGMMGLGGLISVIGGFLFVYICLKAILQKR